MIVDINELKRVKEYLNSINKSNLCDITWMENGMEVVIPEHALDDWGNVGLNNADFILTGAYKTGLDECDSITVMRLMNTDNSTEP